MPACNVQVSIARALIWQHPSIFSVISEHDGSWQERCVGRVIVYLLVVLCDMMQGP